MSSRDLVGRPLVPFFDADDNVNESLDVDYSTRSDVGHLDVDARVWDRDLGYFVYPDGTPSTASTPYRTPQHSAPIAIPPRAQPTTTKTLLTPDMLFSRSAPTAGINGMDHAIHSRPQPTVVTPPVVIENGGQTRSASAKRASQRSKRRSNTPTKTAKSPSVPLPQQSSTDVSSSSSDNATNDRKTNNATPKKNRSKKKNNNGQETATEDLSTNGKWAWSAFQSSPDPKSLPLPPFVVGGGGSPALGAAPPPKDPPNIEERLDPPPAPPAAAVSLEHSMTQDLRRLLNIGS